MFAQLFYYCTFIPTLYHHLLLLSLAGPQNIRLCNNPHGVPEQRSCPHSLCVCLATMTTLALPRRPSLAFSDFGSDDEEHVDTNGADYSARMDELFDDEGETTPLSVSRLDADADDEEEAFVYDGADAQVSRASYREQLRDVLDDDVDDDEIEEREVEHSLEHDLDHPPITIGDEALVRFPSVQSATLALCSSRVAARLLPSCIRRHITRAISEALDQPDALPIYHLRLPLILVRDALLPSKRRAGLFDTLKTLPALPPPDNLAPALLPAARLAHHHLRDECELGIARHLTVARPVELLHALARLILLREHPTPGHRRGEG